MIGVIVSIFSLGATSRHEQGLESVQRLPILVFSLDHLPDVVQTTQLTGQRPNHSYLTQRLQPSRRRPNERTSIHLLTAIGSTTLEDCKYLYNPATGQIEVQWIQGIGSEKQAAAAVNKLRPPSSPESSPQLPWLSCSSALRSSSVVELLGPLSHLRRRRPTSASHTLAIFVGGVMRWLVDYV